MSCNGYPYPWVLNTHPYPWVNGWVMGMGLDAWVGNGWVQLTHAQLWVGYGYSCQAQCRTLPPSGELVMSRPQRIPLISIFPLDPRSTWGTLTKFQALVSHCIHQAWHTLLSPSPHSFMDGNNGPPRLNPLDTKAIYKDIPKDIRICLLKLFGALTPI